MRKSIILLLLSIVIFGTKCRKLENDIPFVPVDISININEPQFFNLTAIGGNESIVGGSLGIVIYRKNFNEFKAFDRHAPYNVSSNCRVHVLDDEVILEDACSGSQWLIIDGSLIKGPAEQPLKEYNTSFNDPILRIYN